MIGVEMKFEVKDILMGLIQEGVLIFYQYLQMILWNLPLDIL